MLMTRTVYKGGVMIRWLGRLGRCMGTSDRATVVLLLWSRFGTFLQWITMTFTFASLYCGCDVSNCSFSSPVRLLCIYIDLVGSHAPHH